MEQDTEGLTPQYYTNFDLLPIQISNLDQTIALNALTNLMNRTPAEIESSFSFSFPSFAHL